MPARSDELLTRNVTKSSNCCGFQTVRYVEADHGSLGLARNTGIAAANGKYVWPADADDLVSYDCIAAMHAMAEATPGSVVFPEYWISFGGSYFCVKFFDDSIHRIASLPLRKLFASSRHIVRFETIASLSCNATMKSLKQLNLAERLGKEGNLSVNALHGYLH